MDPTLDAGLTGLADRPTRLRARPAAGWSTITLVRASASWRHTPGPTIAFLDEDLLTVTVARIPAESLPDAPAGTDLLSRLRMVHGRLLSGFPHPVDASWQHIGGRPAVLDRMSDPSGTRMGAFSLAAVLDADEGLVAVGWAPSSRCETLLRVGLPLATVARTDGDELRWAVLPEWSYREELQISTASVLGQVRLEPLAPGLGLREWTDLVFSRAPFLRDLRSLGDRAVAVRGVDEAWLRKFDWQPSGRGRQLTTVVTGTTAGAGFSFVVDVPLEGPDLFLDPDAVLDLVEVRPPLAGRPLPTPEMLQLPAWPLTPGAPPPRYPPSGENPVHQPTSPPVPATVEFTLPPVPTSTRRPRRAGTVPDRPGKRDRYLDAAVDRVLVAAVDIADADPRGPAVPPPLTPGRPPTAADLDVAAVRAVLDAILMRGWGPPLPWHGRMDVELLALARVARWRNTAQLLLAATSPGRSRSLDDEVWTTARLIACVAEEAREHWVDERSALAGVLDRVRRGLDDPDAAWDDSLMTVVVARPPRFRLKTGFDGGSGHLLWAADDAARDRWDYPVDHFDLPVPLPLARHVQWLIDRYDLDHPDVGPETRRFTPAEFAAFREEYAMTLDELRRVLGPAYMVEDRSGLGPPL